ncbi:MAG: hypothetical protein ABI670_06170 [Chloroflexota bacterium]
MSDQHSNEHKRIDLAQEILNRIITDAAFRQRVVDNPVEALAEAGYIFIDDVSNYISGGVSALGIGSDMLRNALGIGDSVFFNALGARRVAPSITLRAGSNPFTSGL